jgi:hypothetical protein
MGRVSVSAAVDAEDRPETGILPLPVASRSGNCRLSKW